MSNGGVNIHYYHNNLYYNSTNKSFYNTTNPGTNHSVTVVGWDDSFLRTRFNTAAPGNGAFILKNSWGTAWGDRGYFYMSYYDKSLHMGAQFYNAEPVTNYTRVYQYDPLGWVSSYGYTSGDKTLAWISNIFMASINATKIKAISLYTPVSNSTYTLYVRSNVTPDNPMSGTQVAIKTGTIPRAGYNTIPLTTIGTVAANKPFSVVVKLKTPSYNYPIPAEEAVEGFSTAASSAPGQSYFSQNGVSWGSAGAYFNVALKALAVR
jgi:hypothetical protein